MAVLALVAWLAAGLPLPSPQQAEPGPTLPRAWLALEPIDERGRRPFRPDAALVRLVLEKETPRAGELWRGETGEGTWRAVELDADGRAPGGAGVLFAELSCEAPCVRLLRAAGAAQVLVDDVPYAGDLYGYGFPGTPVALSAGRHRLVVMGLRGRARLGLEVPAGALLLGTWDATLPSVVRGGARELEGALPVVEAAGRRSELLVLRTGGQGAFLEASGEPFRLEPLAAAKLPFPIVLRADGVEETARAAGGRLALRVRACRAADGTVLAEATLQLDLREPGALHRRTFRSRADGSVQEVCILPPAAPGPDAAPAAPGDPGRAPRLLLTLHGAGVQAWGQAASYAPLPDVWHVAPTNRRPFGFDWQDWGRADAYEALELALALSGVARRHVVLSGHSMGGHGTWHLAANDLDGFAAAAPSAGWRGFDSYGGRPDGALRALWHAADAASDTEALAANLVQMPLFVLHSEDDESVPAAEARAMVALLRERGGTPALHVEPGQGHWWDGERAAGVDCLTWPAIYELFRGAAIPVDPAALDFTTADPGVDARHHWVRVEQALERGRPLRVRASWDPATDAVRATTENVRRLVLLPRAGRPARRVELDGQVFEGAALEAGGFLRAGDAWSAAGPAPAAEQRPERSGPLKRAFDRGFVLVLPTGGTAEEDRRAFERARHDAAVWTYRANGLAPLLRDADLLADPERHAGRNLILYGNADTNRAWSHAVAPDAPVTIRRGLARVRGEEWRGDDLGLLALLPRRGDDAALVGILGASGPAADLVAASLSLFVSGVGYPDFVVFGSDVLKGGDAGVRAAGWLDPTWR